MWLTKKNFHFINCVILNVFRYEGNMLGIKTSMFAKIFEAQRPMMRPIALKGNDKIELIRLNESDFSSLLVAPEYNNSPLWR